MSQNTSIVNFLIHDANGQPQMVKVVQNTNTQPLAQIKIKQNPVKVFKVSATNEGNNQTPIYHPIKLTGIKCASKLVQVPVDTLARLQKITPKTEPKSPSPDIVNNQNHLTELKVIEPLPELVPILAKSEPVDNIVDSKGIKTDLTEPNPAENKACLPTTMSHASRRRHDSDNDPPAEYTTKRRKHADKVGKGLRHFSMKVCEKVRNKGFTSYNEVADELVLEFATGMHGSADSQQYDQKNIRRRVYDALNVLMAMNIISKEKKEIRWLGLPTNSVQECTSLEKEKQSKLEQIQKKTQQLQELILQHISFKSLIERNKDAENKGIKPSPSSAIHLPFIVVNTSDKALIDCSISNDNLKDIALLCLQIKYCNNNEDILSVLLRNPLDELVLPVFSRTEYMFNFNKRFQIHDDIDILKRMGLLFGLDKGECTEEDIDKVKSMVPKSLESYVEQMGRGVNTTLSDILDEEDIEDGGDEEDALEVEVDADEQEVEGNDYSEDSSDVDV